MGSPDTKDDGPDRWRRSVDLGVSQESGSPGIKSGEGEGDGSSVAREPSILLPDPPGILIEALGLEQQKLWGLPGSSSSWR